MVMDKSVLDGDLEAYCFGDLFMDNYLDIFYNTTFRVYKDVPFNSIKKYNLSNSYYGDMGYFLY